MSRRNLLRPLEVAGGTHAIAGVHAVSPAKQPEFRVVGPHLDGKFTAFGRVSAGIEVADAINRAPSENETPTVPVRIKHAGVAQCQK